MKSDPATPLVRRLPLLFVLGLAFIIGFAAGVAVQDKRVSRTEAVAARERLDLHVRPNSPALATTDLATLERQTIASVMRELKGNKAGAARRLGLSRTQLLHIRLKRYGLV